MGRWMAEFPLPLRKTVRNQSNSFRLGSRRKYTSLTLDTIDSSEFESGQQPYVCGCLRHPMTSHLPRLGVLPTAAILAVFLIALVPTAVAGGADFNSADAVNNTDLPATKSGSLSTSETWYKVEAYYGDRITFDYDVSCTTWWPLIDTCEGQIKIYDENNNEIFTRKIKIN